MKILDNSKTKALSIFAMLLICTSGFGQALSTKDFRLDKEYSNHKIILYEDLSATAMSPYSLDLARELAFFGVGCATLTAGLIMRSNIVPLTEEEIAALDPMDVPVFDRGTITTKKEVTAGDLLLLSSMLFPFAFLSHEETKKDINTLAVMTAEVLLLQSGLNFCVKSLTQRVRPYCYDNKTPLTEKTGVSAKLSFYSGHTSTTAALSFFVAKVFADYLSSSRTKLIIWTSAAIYPALTGLLRLDSGSHFRSDIIVGYVTGALIGYFIPVLHRSRLKDHLAVHTTFSRDYVAVGIRCNF
ncbi:MAG: phosphatase PAP2 family protein [Candidatus Aminicenantes bacterium]|jgi:membrane-associated phospholipid phosphatase